MTDTELDELEAKAKATREAVGCERSLQADHDYIMASRPWRILDLIEDLRQTRRERDWLAKQLEDDLVCYPPNDSYCDSHDCSGCKYTSNATWLKAAREATCNH